MVLCIPQSSSITGASPLDSLMSYPGYSFILPLCRDAVSVFCSPSQLIWFFLVLYESTRASQKFCNILVTKDNSVVMDAFAEIVKVTNHTVLWDTKLTWYSPNANHWICFYGYKHNFGTHSFRPTWPCLIIKVLATQAKFLQLSGYNNQQHKKFLQHYNSIQTRKS